MTSDDVELAPRDRLAAATPSLTPGPEADPDETLASAPDGLLMSAVAPEAPMSFDPAAVLLRRRVLDPPTHPGVLANVDRFEVLRILGGGGMGVVVLGREPVDGKPVAIKLLRPELVGDERAVRQFLIEARHMSRLDHPHILKVVEVCDRPRGPYYVMPFMEQGPLSRLIRPGVPVAEATTLRLIAQVADAVAHAHGKGLIHRDLKPGNVLVDDAGDARVSDFGLVRTVFNDSILDVRQSHCEGTAAYMSPAVARGEAEDTRCDIYALGAVLYEMLTGRPPFSGRSSAEVIAKVRAGPPAPILKLNPKASPALVKVAEGAMARDLRDRYARAADFADDLRRVGRNEPPRGPHGRAEGLASAVLRRAGRHGPRVVAALVILASAVAAGWLGSRALRRPATPAVSGTAAPDAPNTLTDAERAAGWKLLFDGRTTSGWRGFGRPDGTPGWEAVDGSLAHTGPPADVVTVDSYDDFDLTFDWRISPGGNSGVLFRFSEELSPPGMTGPELQLVDNVGHENGRDPLRSAGSCFALYAPDHDATRPAGEWNRGRLLVDGASVEHWLNGVKVVGYAIGSHEWSARVAATPYTRHPMFGKARRGPICLQGLAGRVEFRSVKVRPRLHAPGRAPFLGKPFTIPGTIEAEDFDEGGEGVAYHDTEPENPHRSIPANYRVSGVDLYRTAAGTIYVGMTRPGEWVEYSVDVPRAGLYDLKLIVACVGGGGTLHVEFDRADKTGALVMPDTGRWDSYQVLAKQAVRLENGPHTLRVCFDRVGPTGYAASQGVIGDLDSIAFTPHETSPSPPAGPPVAPTADFPPTRPAGRVVDLMPLIDPRRDAIRGLWRLDGGDLVSDASEPALLEISFAPPTEYDLRTEFTLGNYVFHHLSCGGSDFLWTVCRTGGPSGFEMIGRKHVQNGPPAVLLNVAPSVRHTSLVQVRRDGLRAFVDGSSVVKLTTDYHDLSQPFARDGIVLTRRLGVGSHGGSGARFHRIELIDVSPAPARPAAVPPAPVPTPSPVTPPAVTRPGH